MRQDDSFGKITIQDLIDHLSTFDRDSEITFGNDDLLTFYRTKRRGENIVQIEFNEVLIERSEGLIEIQKL